MNITDAQLLWVLAPATLVAAVLVLVDADCIPSLRRIFRRHK